MICVFLFFVVVVEARLAAAGLVMRFLSVGRGFQRSEIWRLRSFSFLARERKENNGVLFSLRR